MVVWQKRHREENGHFHWIQRDGQELWSVFLDQSIAWSTCGIGQHLWCIKIYSARDWINNLVPSKTVNTLSYNINKASIKISWGEVFRFSYIRCLFVYISNPLSVGSCWIHNANLEFVCEANNCKCAFIASAFRPGAKWSAPRTCGRDGKLDWK